MVTHYCGRTISYTDFTTMSKATLRVRLSGQHEDAADDTAQAHIYDANGKPWQASQVKAKPAPAKAVSAKAGAVRTQLRRSDHANK